MKTFHAAVAGLTATAAFALAVTTADANGRRSIKDEPYRLSWTGFYVGAHAGGAWANVDWDNVSLLGESVNNDSSGFIGGAQIGYNWQVGNIVVGIEASLSGANLSGDQRSVVNPAVTLSTEIGSIATITGRLGYAADHWLIYGKAGWASANVEVSGVNPPINDAFSLDDRRNGWTVGAGLEYLLSRHVSLGLEYSFIDLGSDDVSGVTNQGFAFTIKDVDTEIHSITARLNVRLGAP